MSRWRVSYNHRDYGVMQAHDAFRAKASAADHAHLTGSMRDTFMRDAVATELEDYDTTPAAPTTVVEDTLATAVIADAIFDNGTTTYDPPSAPDPTPDPPSFDGGGGDFGGGGSSSDF